MKNWGAVINPTPDGSTATANNVQTLLQCMNNTDKKYITINEVLTDDNTMLSLTMNENSMKYLARSTDFANDLCSNETFMTYLGQSAYVDNTLLNSDLWVQKIKTSPYKLKVSKYKVCAYATASDADLKSMIDGYYNGWITLADIKTKNSVGDTRSVNLSAMSATGVSETHRAQTVQFVIGDFEHDELTTPINGKTKACMPLLQKDYLMDAQCAAGNRNGVDNTEKGYMNSTNTNTGGWKLCNRRTWCNNIYYNTLPNTLKKYSKSS